MCPPRSREAVSVFLKCPTCKPPRDANLRKRPGPAAACKKKHKGNPRKIRRSLKQQTILKRISKEIYTREESRKRSKQSLISMKRRPMLWYDVVVIHHFMHIAYRLVSDIERLCASTLVRIVGKVEGTGQVRASQALTGERYQSAYSLT